MPKTRRRSLKKSIIVCGQCKMQVQEEEDNSIQCDRCSKIYHALCTKLNKRQFDQLVKNEEEEYICHICNGENKDNVKSELNEIKTQLKKLDQLDILQEAVSFMSKQFEDYKKDIAEIKKKLELAQKENTMLKSEIYELKHTVKSLNDNRVKNYCLVSGIDVPDNTNAVEALTNILKRVDITLEAGEFEDAYFVGNKKSKRKMIVAKFNSKLSKQKVMSAKSKLRKNVETQSIFVNEFLAKETLSLMNHAKSLKAVGYQKVYAMNGKVFTKMNELSKPKLIRSAEDVDVLLLESTKNGSRKSNVYPKSTSYVSDKDKAVNDSFLTP